MKSHLPISAIASALLLCSCASQKSILGDVQCVSAKIDAHIKAFNLDENTNGTIKMKRGEAIQISLTKFGIEGVRVICTQDSVLMVNKLTKTYLRSSYREIDSALGGEGLFCFKNVESYFWNDSDMPNRFATLPIGGFIPLDLKTTYGRSIKAGSYRIPKKINIYMSGADGAIETGEAKLKLSNIRETNTWQPNTEISSKYKSINFISSVKKLFKK